jgi:tetratricopeptide (TPR) repeat protein
MRRTQSVSVGLSPFAFSCRLRALSIFLLILLEVFPSSSFAQQQNRPISLTAELQQRIQSLESAKQSNDPTAVENAGRSVLGSALRDLGGIELTQGSASAAIDLYRRSNDFENASATRIDLAQAYFQTRRFDESLSLVTDVLVADPNDAHAWYLQGKLWMTKQWYTEAVKSFQHVLSLQEDPAASYLLGAALLQTKEYDQAKIAFHKLQEPITDHVIHRILADAYRAANDLDDFKRESALAGPDKKATASASSPRDVVLEDAAHIRSRFEGATPTLQERAQNKRLQLELRTVLANTLNDLGTAEAQQQQYSLALAHFHEAANWNADVPGLLRNTGIAAARTQDYPECIRALRPVVADKPQDNVARAMLGTALFATHSYSEAAQVFKPLGDSALQLHELAYSWAASLVYVNKYSEATDLLNKLEQQKLSTDSLLLVAQLWSQMGNYTKTVDTCHRALDLDSKLQRAHYFAGLALLRLNRPTEAAQELQAELLLDPDNTEAQFNLAFTLLQQSQNAQAVELWKKVLERNPDHPEANYELGKELLTEGKPDESLSYLEASVRLKPQFEPAHYQLQSAYRAVGRKDDADREAQIYRALKAKSRNITLPPPRQTGTPAPSQTERP